MRVSRPIFHITGLRRLGSDGKPVTPVKFLTLRHNKRLAIALKLSWNLCIGTLHLQGKLEETLNVVSYICDDLVWYPMIYKLWEHGEVHISRLISHITPNEFKILIKSRNCWIPCWKWIIDDIRNKFDVGKHWVRKILHFRGPYDLWF